MDFALRADGGIWLIGWALHPGDLRISVAPPEGSSHAATIVARYRRSDVMQHFGLHPEDDALLGIAAWVPHDLGTAGTSTLRVAVDAQGISITAQIDSHADVEETIRSQLRAQQATLVPAILGVTPAAAATGILSLLSRPLEAHASPIRLLVERAIPVAGLGLLVDGWCVDPQLELSHLLLTDEAGRLLGDLARLWHRVPRADVTKTFEAQKPGGGDPGFVALLHKPELRMTDGPLQLAALAVLEDGTVLRQPLPPQSAMGAMAFARHALTRFPDDHPQVRSILDAHIGPAIEASWLRGRPRAVAPQRQAYGDSAPAGQPKISIIVPLYGRYDFMQYQLALFANDCAMRQAELIYVVDDPRILRPVLRLARETAPLFGIPISVAWYDENLGFAGASNVGAQLAQGETLILLNSDVMPAAAGWAPALAEQLHRLPDAGIVGTTLLYEDGSLQHAGMHAVPFAQWGNLPINLHPGKGLPYVHTGQAREVEAVTAACMVITRNTYQALGGLDEGFIQGDFEDSDLCRRAAARGLKTYCADIPLYHLERQSQSLVSGDDWKRKITLYNCWRHARQLASHGGAQA